VGVGRGLGVEVEVLDDERTSTPAVVKDLGRCLTLPAAALCRLIVVVGVICSLTPSNEWLQATDRSTWTIDGAPFPLTERSNE